ncbi:MAG: hypothetical protein PHX79_06295 [Sphaerochaetaceae bacterium]|nr:hypothetical protein [Sphaerochaetaceae bacterium]
MQLDFEITLDGGAGNYPDLLHFPNTQAQVFYLNSGVLYGTPTNKLDNGLWENMNLQESIVVSPDSGMSLLELKVLSGFGIVGSYKTGDTHKLIIYEFAFEMDRYLNNGSIKHSLNNPISNFSLTLENPDIKNPERPGNIVMNEKNALIAPGSKIVFKFGAGDLLEPDYNLGTFYTDRADLDLLGETVEVDGRNLIGKSLKEQTLDENHTFTLEYTHETLRQLLELAHLDNDQYLIEPTSIKHSWNFKPDTTYMNAIEDILKTTANLKIEELTDGTIVIGSLNYSRFEQAGIYRFYRDKDIFSRNIARDDAESYRRVCAHDSEYTVAIYKDVTSYEGWNLQANKTLHVELPKGTSTADAINYANQLAKQLERVGKAESFTGPFRPHIQPGDGAVIVDENGEENLGLITEVTHSFGKSGFITDFTVDSGGVLGKGRLSDYINKISKGRESSSIGYEEG